MPRGAWTPKDERQYRHVKASCEARRPAAPCAKIAAATVNKIRAVEGRTQTFGRHCPRGTVPLKGTKAFCFDRHTRRRVRRTP